MQAPHIMRPYQERAIRALQSSTGNPLLALPTGAGKTGVLAEYLYRTGESCAWYAHRQELIRQADAHLRRAGAVNYSVHTVQSHEPVPDVDVIVVDEAHHSAAASYAKLFQGRRVIGITATPFRRDQLGLGGDMFTDIIVGARPAELVLDGYLSNPCIYSHPAPDTTGIPIRGGDYSRGMLCTRANKRKLRGDIVDAWFKKCRGLRTILYAVNREHGEQLCQDFNDHGAKALFIDCHTLQAEREDALTALDQHDIDILINIELFTEGFDCPDIECVIMARPTASLSLYLQMIGRAMRPNGMCLVLDHAGNARRHGSPLQYIGYTLDDTQRARCTPMGLRLCPVCYKLNSGDVCTDCGELLTAESQIKIKRESGELVLMEDYAELARDTGAYQRMFGFKPIFIDGIYIHPSDGNKRVIYKYYARLAHYHGYNRGWASHRYKVVFGMWPKGFVRSVLCEVSYE